MAPVLVVGTAGAGKSALMAKSAHRATELAKQGAIKMKRFALRFFTRIYSWNYDVVEALSNLASDICIKIEKECNKKTILFELMYCILEKGICLKGAIFPTP